MEDRYLPFAKTFAELTLDDLYEILRIRAEIFVVEQRCFYLDPDGIDRDSIHVGLRDASGALAAYARSETRSPAELRAERDALLALLRRSREQTAAELKSKGQVYRSVGYLTGVAALLLVL